MGFDDFSLVRSSVTPLKVDSTFGTFIKETAALIHVLELFYFVGLKITEDVELKSPSCIITPDRIDTIEENITNANIHHDYHIDIQFAVRHPNEAILAQMILALEAAVREKLRRDEDDQIRIFASVAGHFNTQIQTTNIKPVAQLSKGIFLFSSGINVVYSSWDSV